MLCMTTNYDFNIILFGDKKKPVHRVLKCVTNVDTDFDNGTFFFLLGYSEPEDTFVLNDEFVSVKRSPLVHDSKRYLVRFTNAEKRKINSRNYEEVLKNTFELFES